ncbi:hypothetical protein GW933_02695 [Candidatus Falkowbacteria bacterium]|uniref:Uncharacterized protein n=1 Tax=Candidatus Buchananbacteria bacterium CG10_big_fil_rev_8_21_14_0_10_33_19 TaxID=1974525 RepID=A0A2H0W4C8_9BACT|nr:hypothetical protein [Candidatus Falkowbacteria bacterium]PIS06219.1 MAG: hypothetical protein COT80_01450 [Candidatus Buchananbacteria bacterium CG10_big_fil_rev_8_21_14_0_10_33_19]
MIVATLVVLVIALLIATLMRRAVESNNDLEVEIAGVRVVGDPADLLAEGYQPLINIINVPTSMMDPRPGVVIRQFKSRGYEVAICPVAYKKNGDRSYICSSLWGKYKLHLI